MSTLTENDFSDEAEAKEWGMSLSEYRAEMRRRERNRQAKAAARRTEARSEKRGPRNMNNAADEMKRIVLDVDTDLFDKLEAFAQSRGESIEEIIISAIEAALPDDAPDSDDSYAREKQTKKQSSDAKPAKSVSGGDSGKQTDSTFT